MKPTGNTPIEDALRSIHWSFSFHTSEECPATLLVALRTLFPSIDPQSWPARLDWGGVYVNGRCVREDRPLTPPLRLEYYEPKFRLEDAPSQFPSLQPEHFIFEDDDLAIIFKPAGLPCLPCREQQRYSLRQMLTEHLFERGSPARLHLPSRLDTAVSGVVAVSKSPRMHTALQRLFEQRRVTKTYILEAPDSRGPEGSFLVKEPIGRDPRHPVLRRVDTVEGLPAITSFERLCPGRTHPGTAIWKAFPKTGRTHQLRVHSLHSLGAIVGDPFYGGLPSEALHLISYAIEFVHPFLGEAVRVQIPRFLLPTWVPDHCFGQEAR